MERVLGHTLSRPRVTRWNSLYDSLKQVVGIKDKYWLLVEELQLPSSSVMTNAEFEYLEEYVQCSAPLAEPLDLLQGEKNILAMQYQL